MDATDTKDEHAKTIDVRGLFCPEPVFRTKIEIEKLASGDVPEGVSGRSRIRRGHISLDKQNRTSSTVSQ